MIDNSKIIKELEALDEKLLEAIKKILGANPTKEQLLQFLASPEFDKLINDLGLEKSISQYVNGFDTSFSQSISNFGAMDFEAKQIELISRNIELIKASYGRTVLGYARANSELLRSKLIQSVINGITARQTIKELEGQLISTLTNAPLSTAQIGSVINTSYADFSRATTGMIYENEPEQRFKYVGGVIPTSSDECRWLMQNQKPEGYTRAEIDEGIETPFVYTSGDMIGQVKKIYWGGRVPNYNCLHEWMPIEVTKVVTPEGKIETKKEGVFVPAKTIEDAEIWASNNLTNKEFSFDNNLKSLLKNRPELTESQRIKMARELSNVSYRGVNLELANKVNESVYKLQIKYGIGFDKINVDTLSEMRKGKWVKPLMEHIDGELKLNYDLFHDNTLDKLNSKALELYNGGYFNAKNFEELIAHEYGHLLTSSKYNELAKGLGEFDRDNFVKDIFSTSIYSEKNGRERLAEIFVKLFRGDKLSEDFIKEFNKFSKVKI